MYRLKSFQRSKGQLLNRLKRALPGKVATSTTAQPKRASKAKARKGRPSTRTTTATRRSSESLSANLDNVNNEDNAPVRLCFVVLYRRNDRVGSWAGGVHLPTEHRFQPNSACSNRGHRDWFSPLRRNNASNFASRSSSFTSRASSFCLASKSLQTWHGFPSRSF